MPLEEGEQTLLRDLFLLTDKPIIYVANISEAVSYTHLLSFSPLEQTDDKVYLPFSRILDLSEEKPVILRDDGVLNVYLLGEICCVQLSPPYASKMCIRDSPAWARIKMCIDPGIALPHAPSRFPAETAYPSR